jgi:ligand-binding SRPBCC domain-containing protein
MSKIILETSIDSDIEICFDLSRSIDLHQVSTIRSKEKAIDGRTRGLIGLNEFVTWQATHFGVRQKLTSIITMYNRPFHFRDEQLKGAFKYIIHDHNFSVKNSKVLMIDTFNFQSPFGFIGQLADKTVLTNYLKKLLIYRNQVIKDHAETKKWMNVLNEKNIIH